MSVSWNKNSGVNISSLTGINLYKIKGNPDLKQYQNEIGSKGSEEVAKRKTEKLNFADAKDIELAERRARQARADEILRAQESASQAPQGRSLDVAGGVAQAAAESIGNALTGGSQYAAAEWSNEQLARARAEIATANAADQSHISRTYEQSMANSVYSFHTENANRERTMNIAKAQENAALRESHFAKFQADIAHSNNADNLAGTLGKSFGGLLGLAGTSIWSMTKDRPTFSLPKTTMENAYSSVKVWGNRNAILDGYAGHQKVTNKEKINFQPPEDYTPKDISNVSQEIIDDQAGPSSDTSTSRPMTEEDESTI